MMKFFKYNIKKKNFYFSLVLYFYFLTYKLLFFFQIDIIQYHNCMNFFLLSKKSNDIKYLKINTSNILSIFNNYDKNNKYIFTIFKRDLFFVSTNNYTFINLINNPLISNHLVMFSIDYFFVNVKYLNNLHILYKLLYNNFNIYKIFVLKLLYINVRYIYNISN